MGNGHSSVGCKSQWNLLDDGSGERPLLASALGRNNTVFCVSRDVSVSLWIRRVAAVGIIFPLQASVA